jgi:hypothetical protein
MVDFQDLHGTSFFDGFDCFDRPAEIRFADTANISLDKFGSL